MGCTSSNSGKNRGTSKRERTTPIRASRQPKKKPGLRRASSPLKTYLNQQLRNFHLVCPERCHKRFNDLGIKILACTFFNDFLRLERRHGLAVGPVAGQ